MRQMLYYDDKCNFCTKSVRFLQKRKAKLDYVGLSKATLPKKYTKVDSLILKKGQTYYLFSDAAIRAIGLIGGIWNLIYLFLIVPRFIRDKVYEKLAKKRHCLTKKGKT